MKNRLLPTLIFFFILCNGLYAQTNTITGKITNTEGESLPGVSIRIKGTIEGTITSIEGNYTLPAKTTDILVFSFLGMKTQEQQVGNRSQINIQLEQESVGLDEIVITGYTTQKKANLTGAISTVKTKELSKAIVTNIGQAIQGRLTGVSVSQTTGQPGESINIRIRGLGTLGDNNPLYIIDGISTKDISGISQSDIESIQVLKDASAAIYGSRAANGVILITTKRGKTGHTQVDVSSYYGIQYVSNIPKMLNTQQFIEIQNEAYANDGKDTIRNPYTDNYQGLPDVNYLDELFNIAPIQEHRVTISSGNEKSSILFSTGYTDQKGVIQNSGYTRINARINSTLALHTNLEIGNNLSISNSRTEAVGSSGDGAGGNGGGIVRYAYLRPSAIAVKQPNGEFTDLPEEQDFYGDAYNPIGLAAYRDDVRKQFRLFGNAYLDWDILKTLSFKTDIGTDIQFYRTKRFDKNWGADPDGNGQGRINMPNGLTEHYSETYNLTWNAVLSYKNKFNLHDITGFVGVETITNQYKYINASRSNFENQDLENLLYLDLGEDNNQNNSGGGEGWALLSQFVNINYALNNKYLASINVRRDGSSKFGKENKFGIFPSISFGWRLMEENFMSFLPEAIDNIKLRGSWGKLGGQNIPPYAAHTSVGQVSTLPGYSFGNKPYRAITTTKTGNPKLKWEITTTSNIGLDLGFLNNRFDLSIDYFNKTTSDILVEIPTPAIGGGNTGSEPTVNAAEVSNKGFELNLMYQKTEGKFNFDLSPNFTILKNKVSSLGEKNPIRGGYIYSTYVTLTEAEYPIGSFYLYEAEGLFQSQDEIDKLNKESPTGYYQEKAVPGDIKFKDNSNDGFINEEDKSHVGSAIPKITYGLNTNFSYGNFDLSLFLQGVAGNKVYSEIDRIIVDATRPFNSTTEILERWTPSNKHNNARTPRVTIQDNNNNKRASTRYLQDGDYLRLKNITFGYSMPQKLIEKMKIRQIRVFVSAQNLFTLSKYKGFDPEMGTSDNSSQRDLAVGIDWGTYPSPTVLSFGFNIGF